MTPSTPSVLGMLREALWPLELPRLALRAPELSRLPRGRGAPVLVLPGFGAGDASTLVLQSYLRLLDYDARGWGMGLNLGNVRARVPRIVDLVEAHAERAGEPVRLVGWSLGGLLAREVARERADLVQCVVTLGSPVRRSAPGAVGRVPVTAIYSRNDGVVAWQACIDRNNPEVEHVEVASTHLGLGFDPDVFEIVADRLAR